MAEVNAGKDVVVADDDGIVTFPPEEASAVVAAVQERRYRRHVRHTFEAFVDPISREPVSLLAQCVNLKIVESKAKKKSSTR